MQSSLMSPNVYLSFTPAALLSVAVLSAQPPSPPEFGEEQRVTVTDVMVEIVPRRGWQKEPVQALPSYLVPGDFEVLYDGEPRTVVDVGAFGPAQHGVDRELWTLVIYFDRRLASPEEISWAAAQLVEEAGRLTDLGEVEVVVADPDPRPLLERTRDGELLASVLAEIALLPEGGDHEILALRDEFLGEIRRENSEIDPGELGAFALAEEEGVVRRQLDALLTRLVEIRAGSRRVLWLAMSGFDLAPQTFYRSHLGRAAQRAIGESEILEADLEALERTLAAYGWITFPLVPDDEAARRGGFRIGKWRLGAPRGEARETSIDPTSPHETVGPVMLNFFNLTRGGERDPKRADAFLEFAETLVGQNDLTEATQAFRMALLHYDDDPATTDRQARALAGLGETLERLGRRREARRVIEKAKELDPEIPGLAEVPLGELLDPLAPLASIAGSSTGALVRDAETLASLLSALAYRVRVSYQLPGAPAGALRPIDVRCKRKGCELKAPGWARSGIPDEVAAARLRHWLSDDQYEGVLEVHVRHLVGKDRLEVETVVPPGLVPETADPPALRVTLGYGDPDSISELRHERRRPRLVEARRWRIESDVDRELLPASERSGIAVLVEHLESGSWGASVVELPRAAGAASE